MSENNVISIRSKWTIDDLFNRIQEEEAEAQRAENAMEHWTAYECRVAGKVFWEVVTPENLTEEPWVFSTVEDVVNASRSKPAILKMVTLDASIEIYGEE